MDMVNYSEIFKQSLQRNGSVKRGIALLRKYGATVLDMIKAVRLTLKISDNKASLTVFKYIDDKDFKHSHRKHLADVERQYSELKKRDAARK
jgi:hypothetical protein